MTPDEIKRLLEIQASLRDLRSKMLCMKELPEAALAHVMLARIEIERHIQEGR